PCRRAQKLLPQKRQSLANLAEAICADRCSAAGGSQAAGDGGLGAFASAVAGFVGLAALATAAPGLRPRLPALRRPAEARQAERLLARIARSSEAAAGGAADADSEAGAEGRPSISMSWRRFGGHQQQQAGCLFSSGYGNPHLVRRTIARDTHCWIARRGRAGLARFSGRAEASWSREGEIYARLAWRTPSILGLHPLLTTWTPAWETQLWLITITMPTGPCSTASAVGCAGMCHSIVTGLAHLHTRAHLGRVSLSRHRTLRQLLDGGPALGSFREPPAGRLVARAWCWVTRRPALPRGPTVSLRRVGAGQFPAWVTCASWCAGRGAPVPAPAADAWLAAVSLSVASSLTAACSALATRNLASDSERWGSSSGLRGF
uniref:GS domain-containing protein n=1 Tax=Macrostomum lignano TaxID=282301 RepID=A0A1I8FLJ7_9PLAT